MDRVNQYQFYQLGWSIHPLLTVSQGALVSQIHWTLYQAKIWLEFLLENRVVPLVTSRASAIKLLSSIDAVLPKQTESAAVPAPEAPLDYIQAYNISTNAQTFETVLAAELQTLDTYFVSQQLAYATRDLIGNAEKIFPEKIRNDIPKEAIEDIRQAGKCVAFEIPTAAGFHIVRATESVIRKYYAAIVGKAPKAKMRNWGAYIKNLNQHGADQKITGFLDHIRETYRNPVLHPEVTLSGEDAQVLMGACASAIVQMVQAVQSISSKPMVVPASA